MGEFVSGLPVDMAQETSPTVTAQIREGFAAAAEAVKADEAGDFSEAVKLYGASAKALQAALEAHPGHPKAESLKNYSQTYAARQSFLERAVVESEGTAEPSAPEDGAPESSPSAPKEAGEAGEDGEEKEKREMPPPDRRLWAHWLMQLLERSMTPEGAWVTPNVFVTRDIWLQDANLSNLPAKVRGLRNVMQSLQKAKEASSSVLAVKTAVTLYKQLAEVQVDLAKYLSHIPEPSTEGVAVAELNKNKSLEERMYSFGKFIATKTSSSSAVGGHAQYISLLCQTLQASRFLETWLQRSLSEATMDKDTKRVLVLVADFFERVICGMAVADLQELLQLSLGVEKSNFEKATASG